MTSAEEKEKLPPNGSHGEHNWRGVTITGKIIEIGKSDVYDSIFDCRLVDCVIRTFSGARGVAIFSSTLISCTFEAKKELKNLGFLDLVIRDCTFLGKYSGCRFGSTEEDGHAEVTGCDFSKAKLFDLCDFLEGANVSSLTLPPWPHITITDIPANRSRWMSLILPQSLRVIQEVIGEDGAHNAVSLYLPAHCEEYEDLRAILDAEDYIR